MPIVLRCVALHRRRHYLQQDHLHHRAVSDRHLQCRVVPSCGDGRKKQYDDDDDNNVSIYKLSCVRVIKSAGADKGRQCSGIINFVQLLANT